MSICVHGVDTRKADCMNCQNARHHRAGLETRRGLARLSRWLAPLFGHWDACRAPGVVCQACGIHEAVVPQHTVMHNEGEGSGLLCEGCWRDLSTESKVWHYRKFYEAHWAKTGRNDWNEIERAIRHPYHWRDKSGVVLEWVDQDRVED